MLQNEFYDLCDQKGLLVWEEFMFACSMYPVGKDFLANVAEEVCDCAPPLALGVPVVHALVMVAGCRQRVPVDEPPEYLCVEHQQRERGCYCAELVCRREPRVIPSHAITHVVLVSDARYGTSDYTQTYSKLYSELYFDTVLAYVGGFAGGERG